MNIKRSKSSEHKKTGFEEIKQVNEYGRDYWSARELLKVLEYSEYSHFMPVIKRAKAACKNSLQKIENHFEHVHEMVRIGSGAMREMEDIKLSRYACYLIVQNADPSKESVALRQTYFALQTRKQELVEMDAFKSLKTGDEKRLFPGNELKTHNRQLAAAAKGAGVIRPFDYVISQDYGCKGLYGGLSASDIHKRKGLKKNQKILDHMGSTELAANLFRATQTEEKLKRENIKGKQKANETHFEVGRKVRQTIGELGGVMPEDLPTAESIKKLENQKRKQLSNG